MSDTPLFVTVHQLSERTGLPVPFLNTEAEAGRMPTKKIGRRTFFDVDAAVRTLTDPNLIERLTAERDEARRLLKAVVDMMRDNMAPDATHPKHVCDFIYCPEIATCMVCENWTDALVMCYPDDFQDEEDKPCQ